MEGNVQPANTPKKPDRKLFLIIPLIIFLIFAGALMFVFLNNSSSPLSSQSSDQKDPTWTPLTSNGKGYPIRTYKQGFGDIYIYSIDKKTVQKIPDAKVRYSSVDEASPNRLFTAFVDDSGDLYLLSNGSLEKRKVPTHGPVETVIWSPDSKSLLYKVSDETIESKTYGMGLPDFTKMENVKFDEDREPGYHLFNIETGKDIRIPNFNDVFGFIDNENILTYFDSEKRRLVVFNPYTFEANYNLSSDTFDSFGAGQYDFSPDGKKWAYTLSRNPTTDGNIIYSDVGKAEGITVDSGGWAEVQGPKFSPDGSKILYVRSPVINGVSVYYPAVYDIKTGRKTVEEVNGSPSGWLDNENIIMSFSENSPTESSTKTIIYNIKTKEATTLPL